MKTFAGKRAFLLADAIKANALSDPTNIGEYYSPTDAAECSAVARYIAAELVSIKQEIIFILNSTWAWNSPEAEILFDRLLRAENVVPQRKDGQSFQFLPPEQEILAATIFLVLVGGWDATFIVEPSCSILFINDGFIEEYGARQLLKTSSAEFLERREN